MALLENLFSRKVTFVLKNSDLEDQRKCRIQVDLERQTVSTPLHKKELIIRLTDDSDLFFLYSLCLGEEDFQSLKSQQGLLVDFSSFPQKLMELFELCLLEESKENPKFIIHFVINGASIMTSSGASLNIVETNPFKHLTHLSLKLLPGSDTDVKKYLAGCLQKLKGEKTHLADKLSHTETDLQQRLKHTQEILSARSVELDNVKTQWVTKTQQIKTEHAQEVTAEREKSLQTQTTYQQKYDRERRELEQAHMKIVKQMEARAYEMEANNKELMDKKYKNEAQIRETKAKLSSYEEENHNLKQEMQSLRQNNSQLDGTVHDYEKQINQLLTRIAVLDQEVLDKEQVLTKSSHLLGAETEQKRKLERDMDGKQRQITKLETNIKAMSEELIKGNQIIKKLQGEIKTYHTKLKLRNKITTEQENILGEKEEVLDKLKKEFDETKSALKAREEENKKLSENLETTMQKLEESRQLLKTNENVINWLNKQVTENQLVNTGHHGTFEMPTSRGTTVSYKAPGSMSQGSSQLHNFSTPGQVSWNDTSKQSTGMGVGRFNVNSNAPQVQYRPVAPRQTGLPVPVHKSTPIPAIPEEITPTPRRNRSDKENDPLLDPKYFQTGADPIRKQTTRAMSPITATQPSLLGQGQLGEGHFGNLGQAGIQLGQGQTSNRLSQQTIVAKINTRPVQPTLVSAYFPNKLKTGST